MALWTAVSALMHILILILPFAIIALPAHLYPKEEVVPVKVVGGISPDKGSIEAKESVNQPGMLQESGTDGAGSEAGASFETEGKVGADYMTLLKAKIFFVWKYPDDAIQKGQQGKVSISFVLNSKGELMDIGIFKSSGFESLDSAVMDAVKQASPFGPLPPDDAGKPLKITGHFCYVLD
jgi:protein TonB